MEGRGSFMWPDNGEAIITNYDILPTEDHPELALVPAGCTLVIDEGHNAKNPKTSRYQRLELLISQVKGAGGRVFMLTATPLLNRPPELWTLLKLLDVHTEAYGTWGRFCRAFNKQGASWGTPTEEAAEGLARVCLRRTKAEVRKDIPPKMYESRLVEVKLTATEDAEVREAEEVLLREGPGVDFNKISKARAVLAKAKIPALNELVEAFEDAGEPVVVFSCHRAPIDQLANRGGWALITGDTPPEKRTAIEDAFQRGELKGIGATVRAGGVAITLTKAANTVFVDRDWTPALNMQAEDRLCRIGQTRTVNVIRLVAEDSLDQRVEEIISDKTVIIENSVEKVSNPLHGLEGVLGFGTASRLAELGTANSDKQLPSRVPPANPAQARDFKEGIDVLSIDCPF
jgi:SNF2 family DNA or RNA helicase